MMMYVLPPHTHLQAAMLRAASRLHDESFELLRDEVIEAEERERRATDLLEAKEPWQTETGL